MITEFTPFASFGGGVLIGLAAILLMATLGRILGATGILAGFIQPLSKEDWLWRAFALLGMISTPLLILFFTGSFPVIQVPVSYFMLIIGGLLVGFGVTLGGGCTSGHGVCGNARRSPRSLVATITFMLSAFLTVFVIRHILGF